MGEGVGRGGKMCHQGLRGGVRWGGEGTELPWEVAGPPLSKESGWGGGQQRARCGNLCWASRKGMRRSPLFPPPPTFSLWWHPGLTWPGLAGKGQVRSGQCL